MGLDITRIGEPRLLSVPGDPSGQIAHALTTTSLPSGARGDDWFRIFSEQLTGPLLATHDRADTITVTCDTRDFPNWLWLVDVAIMRSNEKEDANFRASKRPPE